MAINSWIGIVNGIGFKQKISKGGPVPPIDITDALLLEVEDNPILLENMEYIKLEQIIK